MKNLIGVGEPRRGVFVYKEYSTTSVQVHKAVSYELWHRRMGHPSSQALSKIPSDIFFDTKNKHDLCDVCLRAKQTCIPFPIGENKALSCFDLIHCDIWGGYRVKSFCGASYFLTILDDASRGVWNYLMQEKSEASQLIRNFCTMVNAQFGVKVKVIRSDNGSEVTSGPMKKFYGEHGTIHQTSCVDTPQQNGRVERNHRHVLNAARALQFQAHLPMNSVENVFSLLHI